MYYDDNIGIDEYDENMNKIWKLSSTIWLTWSCQQKDQKELAACKSLVGELEIHEDAWPFLLPVNTRQFPTYKKIIKKPMDLSVIKKKLEENQ